jgi:phosphoribosyl 1,2-cyclic phosphate phosphodiesterase
MKVTILGCGGSDGVPMIGGPDGTGDWGNCDPANPRNRRTRPSILVEAGETSLLVDASPDLKQQMIENRLDRVTAVAFTHEHADHSHGIHELRRLATLNQRPMDAWASADTMRQLQIRFGYAFEKIPGSPYPEILMAKIFDDTFEVGGLMVQPFDQDHGFGVTTNGFRFGPVAYSTDVAELDDAAYAVLSGIHTWIVDCQQLSPHPTHAHLEKTLGWIEKVAPQLAYLTHMGPDLDYEALQQDCPDNVAPAYDGMILDFDVI